MIKNLASALVMMSALSPLSWADTTPVPQPFSDDSAPNAAAGTQSSKINTTAQIVVYTNKSCNMCTKIKAFLNEKGVSYQEIEVNTEETLNELKKKCDRGTVPQVFVNDKHVGSYKELFFADMFGNLPALLGAAPQPGTPAH